MTAVVDVSTEFRERRSRTWRAVRWWLLAAFVVGSALAFGLGGENRELSRDEFTFFLAGFVVVATAILFFIRGILVHYRCPNCNEIPMTDSWKAGGGGLSYRRGVDLNPTLCPNCGALLKAR